MRTLTYHDVVVDGQFSASGFSGGDAAIYKLESGAFHAHLARLHAAGLQAGRADEATPGERRFLLTFDDGGVSGFDIIAPALERFGWIGHFFMTSGWLGARGFLHPEQLRELARRGHLVGSHSETHPLRMSSCSRAQLVREWTRSVEQLANVLGERPHTASIPGGAFSPAVAEAAAEAGIRILFTSEPTSRTWPVGDLTCFGRYTVWRGTSPDAALALASGRGLDPLMQRVSWHSKKIAKAMLGPAYQRLREQLLASRDSR